MVGHVRIGLLVGAAALIASMTVSLSGALGSTAADAPVTPRLVSDGSATPPLRPLGVGVQSDLQPDSPLEVQRREIALLQAAGVTWVRIVLNWYVAEPQQGRYDEAYFRGMEDLLARLQAAGLRVMLLVLATPPWANPAGWDAPPLRMRDIGEFVAYAVRRLGARVQHWEIWNEPDWEVFWRPRPNVERFVEMLAETYMRGKAAAPRAVFISGGLAGNNVGYLRQMYALGAGRYFDALGVHPYVFRRAPDDVHPDVRHSFHGIAELRAVMVAHGDAAKPVWITEMSWPTHRRAPGGRGDWAEGVSVGTQAAYLTRAYEKIYHEYPFVDVAMWYNLRDKGVDPTNVEHNFGLVRHDFQLKPAYRALQLVARRLAAPRAVYP